MFLVSSLTLVNMLRRFLAVPIKYNMYIPLVHTLKPALKSYTASNAPLHKIEIIIYKTTLCVS